MRHQEVEEKFFSKVLKRSRVFRFCGHCILKNTDLSTACYSNMGQNMGQIVWYQIALNYSELLDIKTKEKVPKSYDFRTFYGCGGRTRTYDLRVMRGFWVSLAFLNPLKRGELVPVFQSFTGNSEQFSYSPTIVDTHVCTFFDGVLEKVLERKWSVRYRKTRKMQQMLIEKH